MRLRFSVLPAALLVLATACSSVLDVQPTAQVATEVAITDRLSAQAALAGVYDELQEDNYYGGDFILLTEIGDEDAEHTGTFDTYFDADVNNIRATNGDVQNIWEDVYAGINRANTVIARVPDVPGLSTAEKNDMVGQAYFLRALNYHNAVRLWGGVPLRTKPVSQAGDIGTVTRATEAEVYTQILADLTQAASLISAGASDPGRATRGAVEALRSRVMLYQGNWAGVVTAANAAEAFGYSLPANFADVFAVGTTSTEDVFRVKFNAADANNIGFYFLNETEGGRWEVGPTDAAFSLYESGDERLPVTLQAPAKDDPYVAKWPTSNGVEAVHVIRFAEVLLNKAEAQAQLNDLTNALATVNRIRTRANLLPLTFLPTSTAGVHVDASQAAVIAAIRLERHRELAFEGDRWFELRREGLASVVGGDADKLLWPIPQSERNLDPNVKQNPGY